MNELQKELMQLFEKEYRRRLSESIKRGLEARRKVLNVSRKGFLPKKLK